MNGTMEALTWQGEQDVRVDEVPKPEIVQPTDAIIEVTATAICCSDLHLYNGYMPTMEEGDVIGHEPMGEVVETGSAVETLEIGDRVVVPFPISCGSCWFCEHDLYSLCDESNPNAEMAREEMGHRRPACSASRTCSAASTAPRRSTCGFPTPTSAP